MTLRPASVRWGPAALLVVMAVGTIGTHHRSSPPGPVWMGVLLATGAVLPVPLAIPAAASLVASGALTGCYFAAGYADGPVFLAVPAVAFTVVSAAARRLWAWIAAAAALGVAGLLARDAWHHVARPTLWQCVGFVALVAAASALAAALRSRREATAERARTLATEERLRMAADLHDGVGHGLAVIAMQAGAALHVLDRDPGAVRANLEAIRDTSRESLDQLRGQLAELTDGSTVPPAGRASPRAPTPGLAEVPALVERVRSGGLEVRLSLASGPVPDRVGRAAYGVVQEGLTNVLRHAAATRADVSVVRVADDLVVTVTDDGRGAASDEPAAAGFGIAGMRSRVQALGGALHAGPAGAGFVVRATIPLGADR